MLYNTRSINKELTKPNYNNLMKLTKIIRLFNIIKVGIFSTLLIFLININISFADSPNKIFSPGIVYQKEITLSKSKSTVDQTTHLTSGTGFFVSNDTIVTNEHVVQRCGHIRIRGAVDPGYAELIALDKDNDLALLKTSRTPRVVAPLRGNSSIKVGEEVNVMGYPLDRSIKGKYLVKKAVITNNHDVYEGVERIQFTDTVEKGNSGGPLLDTNGTVIGVIVGKMSFYLAGSDIENTKPIKTSSVAITLKNLKDFLNKNNIFYRTDNTVYKFADSSMENKAKDYIVNIQCVKDEDEDDTKGAFVAPPQSPHG